MQRVILPIFYIKHESIEFYLGGVGMYSKSNCNFWNDEDVCLVLSLSKKNSTLTLDDTTILL